MYENKVKKQNEKINLEGLIFKKTFGNPERRTGKCQYDFNKQWGKTAFTCEILGNQTWLEVGKKEECHKSFSVVSENTQNRDTPYLTW